MAMNMAAELPARGYRVGVFAMDYPLNLPRENYYVAPAVGFDGNLLSKFEFACRTLGFYHVKAAFRKALKEFSPEIVHLHNIHSHLSPVIAKMAKEAGCRVVWTMHDYKLVCPAYNMLNGTSPCEICLNKRSGILKHKCMKGSFPASLLAYAEALRWNRKMLEKHVDCFLCPSRFLARELIRGGYDRDKIKVVPNFIDSARLAELSKHQADNREDYYAYVGRFSPEKGVESLLEAAKDLPYKLKLAGDGALLERCKKTYSKYGNVEFLGNIPPIEVCRLMAHSSATVVPSLWYENNPLSIIESLCAGTPVIGANIGGIPELLTAGNGLTFAPGDVGGLKDAIAAVMRQKSFDHRGIALSARAKFSFDSHLEKLETIYNEK